MIYYFDEINKFTEQDFFQSLNYISDERIEQINKYRFFEDKRLSSIAYLILRIAIYDKYKINKKIIINAEEGKKPSLAFDNIKFNLSHCKEAVACSIDDFENGVDVQEIVSYEESIGDLFLSKNEKQLLEKNNFSKKLFTKFWTLKECYGKFLGLGIIYDLKETDFSKFLGGKYKNLFIDTYINDKYILSSCSLKKLEPKKISYEHLKKYFFYFDNQE